MKTSARNQFPCTISAVNKGPTTSQVTIGIASGLEITASMTTAAAERLAAGQPATATFKAYAVMVPVKS